MGCIVEACKVPDRVCKMQEEQARAVALWFRGPVPRQRRRPAPIAARKPRAT